MTIPFKSTTLSSSSQFFYLELCVNQNETTNLHYKTAPIEDCDVAFSVKDVKSAIFREMKFRHGESSWEVFLSLQDSQTTKQVRVGHFETKKEAMEWFERIFG